MSYLFAILLFSLLIFIHELGHFTAAKAFGIQVNEFSLFMGPPIWKKQIGETLYAIRCIPIGGYCAMEGEDGGSDHPRAFAKTAWWKRLIVLLAGAFMNFLIGVALLAVFFAPGKQFIMPEIGSVEENCGFRGEYGIQEGDRLYSLDGERIYIYTDFSLIMSLNGGDFHDLEVIRNGEKITLQNLNMAKREFRNEDGSTSLRYGFSFSLKDATFTEKVKYTWDSTRDIVRLVRLSLQMLFSGKAGVKDVSGPVGIVQEMAQVAKDSSSRRDAFYNLIYFGGFIAINLAVMNLLPIPALDGGRVVGLLLTTAVEAVTGRRVNPRIEGYIHGAGMVLLLALMGVVMFKDILFAFMR